jgi:uncharacterized repeat protein (TIGR01451 family)
VATIVLRRPVGTWWRALMAIALVVVAGGVMVAGAPPARAAQNPTACASSIGLVNGGFEQPAVEANSSALIPQAQMPGWKTTAADNNIEIWHQPFQGVSAAEGTQHAQLNGTQPSVLYQDLPTIPGTVMRWSLAHRGRTGNDTMAVSIGPAGGTLVEQARMTDGQGAWGRYSGFYTVPAGQSTTRFSFAAINTDSGNRSSDFLDDISFGTSACVVGTQTVSSSSGGPYAQAGDVLTIAVKADSGGGSPATGTVLTSPLPAGVTFVPGSIRVVNGAATTTPTDGSRDDVGEYDPTARRVVVRLGNGATASTGGTLSTGEAGTVTYQVRVDPSTSPSTATLESTVRYTDPLTGTGRTATTNAAIMVLNPVADLAVTLARTSTGAVVAGLPVTYTATLTNNGGSSWNNGGWSGNNGGWSAAPGEDSAYGTRLTSQLPTALTGVSGTTSGGTCTVSGRTLTCDVGTLARNATRTVTLTGTVASDTPPAAGGLVLSVTGSTASRDPDPRNDTASVTSDVTAKADVGVILSATPTSPTAGTDITYTAVLTNRGPSTARSVVLSDPVPAGTSNPRASVPGGTCSVSASGTVQCTVPTLATGASTSVTIVVLVAGSSTGTVQNTVTVAVGTTSPDPDLSNNTATVVSTLREVADIRTVLSLPTGNIPLGSSFPYTLTITNQGPSTAVNIGLSYTAPAGFQPTSLPAGCSLSGCSVSSLAPGASVVLKGTAQVTTATAPGRATVTVTATASTADPNPGNNTGSAVVLVGAPSLQVSVLGAITDTRSTRGADVGDQVVWTYVVANTGDVDVKDLTVVLPDTTTAVPATCQPGTLPKGAVTACRAVAPQSVTAADVRALAATTTVQVTASWVGGTEVRSPSAGGSLVTVLPSSMVVASSAPMPGAYFSAPTLPALQEAASRTDLTTAAPTSGRSGRTAVAVGALLSAAAGTALTDRALRRRS